MPNKSRTPKLSPSAEDYLEATYLAGLEGGEEGGAPRPVRTSDVAERMQVRLPSVVAALKSLAERGLVEHEPYRFVELSESGRAEARKVYARHRALFSFINGFLGVKPETAELDACRIEHSLSPETLRRLLKLVELLREGGDRPSVCLYDFRQFADGKTGLHSVRGHDPDSKRIGSCPRASRSCPRTPARRGSR